MAKETSQPRSSAYSVARAAVDREARRTRRALWVEEAIRAFWPVWALAALALGLMMLGVPASLPREWHYALLAGFAAAFLFFALRGVRAIRRPTERAALARLDAGAPGRPAQTFDDALAAGGGDKGTEALWAAHKLRLAQRAAALRAPAPDLRASHHDPLALRHGALVVLAAGAIAYFGADATRLSDQLKPAAGAAGAAEAVASIEAWASPPAYTGVTPVYLTRLSAGDSRDIRLPEGAEISIRVFDTAVAPVLTETVSGAAAAFADQGAQVYDAVFNLEQSGAVTVTLDDEAMGAWTFSVIEDAPPTIEFVGEVTAGARGATTFTYRAGDDYGVRFAEGSIRLDPAAPPPVEGAIRPSVYEPIALELPLPLTGDSRTVEETLIEDLTEHPWAGLPVEITIRASDAAGQTAEATRQTIMPGRRFFDPMAKALVEQRRNFAFSPDTAPRVLDVLEAVMTFPEEVFDDTTAYLTARMAVRRLGYALEDGRLEAESKSIIDLLWKAAIRLEDGDLSSAAERLARAQEKLRQAIEEGASDDEISRLMDELRQAMRDYLAEMAREALRDQANGQQQQQQQGQMGEQQMLTQQDLEQMLNELEEALRNGQQDLARQMLQALQEMMNNLQMAQPGQGQQGPGQQMMDQMGDMIGEQQDLADRSFDEMREGQDGQQGQQGQQGQEGQQGQQGQQGQGQQGQGRQQGRGQQPGQGQQQGQGQATGRPGDDPGQIARDQQALQQLLNDLRGQMPGVAGEDTMRALDEADRAMGDAVDSLDRGDLRGAVDDQVRALDALREGRQQMARDLAEAQGQQDGQQAGRDGRGRDAEDEDPLGRPRASDGPTDGDSTRLPGASMGKRARELQEEIRRRAGERERDPEELDYLERLLDRF